jgi:hypothetical protein
MHADSVSGRRQLGDPHAIARERLPDPPFGRVPINVVDNWSEELKQRVPTR